MAQVPIDISTFVRDIEPEKTVLLFGAGSSIPSNAPSVERLQTHFARVFGVPAQDYTLAEQTGIIEQRTRNRPRLIAELRSQFTGLRPSGALLNLPLYNWKSIFTTNYDELIEDTYSRRARPLVSYTSNFDFGTRSDPMAIQLFKLHGTIGKDIAFGDKSRIVLTLQDYDSTEEYREYLFDRLKGDLAGSQLIIIGHRLADEDINAVVKRALAINARAGMGGRITLFIYTPDEGRAELFEARGGRVCFGGIDDFFAGLAARIGATVTVGPPSGDPLDLSPSLRPATLEIVHAADTKLADVSAMYNGWPASYADIAAGLTFQRNVANKIEQNIPSQPLAILLGAAGVGKTTAARQVGLKLTQNGYFGWEHKSDQVLVPSAWRQVAKRLADENKKGALIIDDAHSDLSEVNDLVDMLASDGHSALKLLLVSSRHQWYPRVKSPNMYRMGTVYNLSQVQGEEIDRLLGLIEMKDELRRLIEPSFAGFSRPERRRRLVERCHADMFVCMKNIFSSDKFDDIILREYADLSTGSQEVYRSIAALESAGVHVHRQLVIRFLGIEAMAVASVLNDLTDIIHEVVVNEREGIYAWRGRHRVIMDIVADHKFYDNIRRFDFFSRVIDAISPTYDIEIRTIRDLCSIGSGIPKIADKEQQNILLRKMTSVAPRERVPRHRLLRNLIELGQFERAETEIRLFDNDFGLDGPAVRYQIDLATARAVRSPGLLQEDRVVLLEKARGIAEAAVQKYQFSKAIIVAYCELGFQTVRLTGRTEVFDRAIQELKDAEDRIGDADISRIVARYERRMRGVPTSVADESDDLDL
jgi:hypothetical protein